MCQLSLSLSAGRCHSCDGTPLTTCRTETASDDEQSILRHVDGPGDKDGWSSYMQLRATSASHLFAFAIALLKLHRRDHAFFFRSIGLTICYNFMLFGKLDFDVSFLFLAQKLESALVGPRPPCKARIKPSSDPQNLMPFHNTQDMKTLPPLPFQT